jgi:hypothetical protein
MSDRYSGRLGLPGSAPRSSGRTPTSASSTGQVRVDGAVQVAAGQRGPLGVDELPQVRCGLGDEGSAGSAEQQGAHPLGPGQRHLDGNARAEGGADHVTALNAEGGQRVDHVIRGGEGAARTCGGLAETAKVQPDSIAFRRERRPLRVPHPAIGDAGVEEDDGQVSVRAGTVVRNTGGRAEG